MSEETKRKSSVHPAKSKEIDMETTQHQTNPTGDIHRYKSLIRNNVVEFTKGLFEACIEENMPLLQAMVSAVDDKEKKLDSEEFRKDGQTILHACVLHCKRDCVEYLCRQCKSLISASAHDGLTPLHVAVAKRDLEMAKSILRNTPESNIKCNNGTSGAVSININQPNSVLDCVLHQHVTGKDYRGTCLEGEIPLTIAAWNMHSEMIDLLLNFGARRDHKDSHGNTVFHTLIKLSTFGDIKRSKNKMDKLKEVFGYILEKDIGQDILRLPEKYHKANDIITETLLKQYFLFINNEAGFAPIQYAAKLGAAQMFEYIFTMDGVYKQLDDTDCVSDSYIYDITEVDSNVNLPHKSTDASNIRIKDPNTTQSSLELLMSTDADEAFQFMKIAPIKKMISTKWKYYRWHYFIWGLQHLSMMIIFTIACILRPVRNVVIQSNSNSSNNTHGAVIYAETKYPTYTSSADYTRAVFEILVLFYTVIFLFSEAWDLISRRHTYLSEWTVLGNGPYRIVFSVYAICIIVATMTHFLSYAYADISLIFALVLGWWFLLFFTRGIKQFSFFTVMIHRVLSGDIFTFSVVFLILLVSFSSAIFVAYKDDSSSSQNEFTSYWAAVLTLFKVALGFVDLETVTQTRKPYLTLVLFCTFVILAYIVLLNMLIALLSETFAEISKNRESQWRLQRLSLILLIERRLPQKWRVQIGDVKNMKRCKLLSSMNIKVYSNVERLFFKMKYKTSNVASDYNSDLTSEKIVKRFTASLLNKSTEETLPSGKKSNSSYKQQIIRQKMVSTMPFEDTPTVNQNGASYHVHPSVFPKPASSLGITEPKTSSSPYFSKNSNKRSKTTPRKIREELISTGPQPDD